MRFLKNLETMGKKEKNFDDLSKNKKVKEIEKDDMKNILGGREKMSKFKKFMHLFHDILPQ